MELTPTLGIGTGELQRAARAEANRIMKESDGDELAGTKMLIEKLRDLELIHHGEVETLGRLCEIGFESTAGKKNARDAYFEVRQIYHGLLADGGASPVALALASSASGSYTMTPDADNPGNVVFAKIGNNWETRLGIAGAVIGGALSGGVGGAIGGQIGGILGGIVDECKGK